MITFPAHSPLHRRPRGFDEHLPLWSSIDLIALDYEDLLSDGYNPFHTPSAGFDQVASTWAPGTAGPSVPPSINKLQQQALSIHVINHNVPSPSESKPYSELSPGGFCVSTAEDQTSASTSSSTPSFTAFPSPDTISAHSLSGPTTPELEKSLQIVQYSHVQRARKVFRATKASIKSKNRVKKPRGLRSRPEALKTDTV